MHFETQRKDSKRETNKFSDACTFKPTIAQADRPIGQSEKPLEDQQKIADEQTAKAFELYIARLKQNSPSHLVADV